MQANSHIEKTPKVKKVREGQRDPKRDKSRKQDHSQQRQVKRGY